MSAPDDVAGWLDQIGLAEYAAVFAEHAIDRELLADLGGSMALAALAEPLAAWRVAGEGRAQGRFEALHGERLTPLVGPRTSSASGSSAGPGPRTATASWCCSRASPGSASRA